MPYLPILLEQRDQEVDGERDVRDELLGRHLYVADRHREAQHLQSSVIIFENPEVVLLEKSLLVYFETMEAFFHSSFQKSKNYNRFHMIFTRNQNLS